MLAKTSDNDGYAYSKLTMVEKDIRKLHKFLRNYPHLKYIDISNNAIREISILHNIPYLLSLKADANKIEDINIFTEDGKFTYL